MKKYSLLVLIVLTFFSFYVHAQRPIGTRQFHLRQGPTLRPKEKDDRIKVHRQNIRLWMDRQKWINRNQNLASEKRKMKNPDQ